MTARDDAGRTPTSLDDRTCGSDPDSRRTEPHSPPRRRYVAIVTALGGIQLMAAIDGTVAVVALLKIQNELGLSDAGRSWVITAYALTFGGLMLLGGRLGDTIGRKRTFIVGVALFTIASAMCAIARDGGALDFGPAAAGHGRRDHHTDLHSAGGDHLPKGAGNATRRRRCSAPWTVSAR